MDLEHIIYRMKKASTRMFPVAGSARRRNDLRFAFQLGRAPIVFASQAKSGRTWVRVMLSKVWQDRYQAPADQVIQFDNYHRHDVRIPIMLFVHDGRAEPGDLDSVIGRCLRRYRDKQLIFLFRDPRDVVVSRYYQSSRRNQNPVKTSMIDYVRGIRTGLPNTVDFLNVWAKVLPNLPTCLVLQYETLRADPAAGLRQIGAFLNMDLSETEIAAATAYAEFDNMQELERSLVFRDFEMRPGDPNDPNSFKVRRGKIGGYRDELGSDMAAWMDDYVGQNLSDYYLYGSKTEAT